jgi:hypothetical protein
MDSSGAQAVPEARLVRRNHRSFQIPLERFQDGDATKAGTDNQHAAGANGHVALIFGDIIPISRFSGGSPPSRCVLRRAFCFARSAKKNGGGDGIRTHGTVSGTHAFQACAFNRSATPPLAPFSGVDRGGH